MTASSVAPPILADNPHAAATYNEVLSLAHHLCETEGWTLGNAMQIAADDLGFLLASADSWDRAAFFASNDDALPF